MTGPATRKWLMDKITGSDDYDYDTAPPPATPTTNGGSTTSGAASTTSS